MKTLLVSLLLFFGTFLYGQTYPFKIYFFENRYSSQDKVFINNNNIFGYYDLFSQGYLESTTRKGHIDLNKVQASLNKYYPIKSKSGNLVLDFEGLIFSNLQNYAPGSDKFDEAEKEFIQMLNLVKQERPNLKIGIYGIPFRFYYDYQRKYNRGNKFDNILKKTDFIAPSLYLLYSENENKEDQNVKFLKDNLDVALEIGKRINKPVIPFFWYMVNPVNRKYGYEMISAQNLKLYLNTVKNYSYKNFKVNGILWWDVSEKFFGDYVYKANQGARNSRNIKSKMDLFRYYQLEK